MMFTENEEYSIEQAKFAIKTLINTRYLLWNGIQRNVVIAGGFFTSALQNSKFKDIDIFILNDDMEVFQALVKSHNVNQSIPSAYNPINPISGGAAKPNPWSRSRMMNYNNNPNIVDVINNDETQAQYILTKYKTREELLEHFDYKHCKVSYVPQADKLYITRETFDCIKNKVLKINNEKGVQKWRQNRFLRENWVPESEYVEDNRQTYKDAIRESYEQLKEKIVTQQLGLPPMQQQGSYIIGEDALKHLGITAQTVEELLQTK